MHGADNMISLILLGLLASTTTARPEAASRTYGSGKFKYFGVDESVAEFGLNAFPGTWGKEFYFPDNDAISVSPWLPTISQLSWMLTDYELPPRH